MIELNVLVEVSMSKSQKKSCRKGEIERSRGLSLHARQVLSVKFKIAECRGPSQMKYGVFVVHFQ